MAELPAALVRELERQLRRLAPWHVRVSVESTAQDTSVRIWSLPWLERASMRSSPPETLEVEVANICLFVQGFIGDRTQRLWPTELLAKGDEILIPVVIVGDEEVTVAWSRNGETVFRLRPLPLGRHS